MKAYLILADGSVLEGEGFGKKGVCFGEVVFSTGMTGYQETLTDPSYFGQIVTMTYPLIGNYGVNSADMESEKSYVKGLIVREFCDKPSNFRCENDFESFLKEQNIIGISDIDTRHLTRKIRDCGVMNGAIVYGEDFCKEELLNEISSYAVKDAVKSVSTKALKQFKCENGKYKVCLFDFGYKKSILEALLERGCDVDIVNAYESPETVLGNGYDGIVLSNGPGDPNEYFEIIENIKEISGSDIPVLGIGLGHQLAALASGIKIKKLTHGHRGVNHPVKDISSDRTYITSQNHGYAADADTLDGNIGEVTHININDGTIEGIRYKNKKIFTVQFYPDVKSGLTGTGYVFDEFTDMMKGGK